MIQLSIDPATRFIGYSIMDTSQTIGYDITKYGLINIHNNAKLLSDRLLAAYNNAIALISQYSPNIIALEDQFYNTKTPTVKDIIRVSGIIILAAKQKSVPVVMYPPQVIKLAVAKKGNADKKTVASVVLDLYKDDSYVSLLKFSEKSTKTQDKTDDIFDSIAINLTHRFTRNGKQT